MANFDGEWSRREWLRLGIGLGVGALSPTRWVHAGEEKASLPLTPNTTMGPYYPLVKPEDHDTDLTQLRGRRGRAQGQCIELVGRIRNRRGEPIRGAKVEIWQANTFGRYTHPSDPNPAALDPDFQGYGVQLTDREGRFRFRTIKPGPYPQPEGGIRSPHIHFDVTGRVDRKVTQMFFPGEPLNETDVVFSSVRNRERLLPRVLPPTHDMDPATALVAWDIVVPTG